jgi:uncharacterized repeat protein (TIGR01451 family)
VDDFFEGVITNTATITHANLVQEKVVTAVAYITDKPVLKISKVATPDPVLYNTALLYQVEVTNLGQQATSLVVTDTVPANTSFIPGTASSGGQLVDGVIRWNLPVIESGDTIHLTFQVKVLAGDEIINSSYAVRCNEGVSAYGERVVTKVRYLGRNVYLPIAFR